MQLNKKSYSLFYVLKKENTIKPNFLGARHSQSISRTPDLKVTIGWFFFIISIEIMVSYITRAKSENFIWIHRIHFKFMVSFVNLQTDSNPKYFYPSKSCLIDVTYLG